MTVPCPHCSQEVSIEDAGRFACPHCGNDFEAVNDTKGPPPLPVRPSKAPAKRIPDWFIVVIVVGLASPFYCLWLFNASAVTKESAQKPESAVVSLSKMTATRSGLGVFEITGTALNQTSSNLRDIAITFTLFDDKGSVVDYATDRLAILGPYQRWRYRATAFSKDASRYSFKAFTVDLFGTAAVKVDFEK